MVARWKSGFASRLERCRRAGEVDICGESEDGSASENELLPLVAFGGGAAYNGGSVGPEVVGASRGGMDVNGGARGVDSNTSVDERDSARNVVLLTRGASCTVRASSGAARGELGEILRRCENSSGLAPTRGETLETTMLGWGVGGTCVRCVEASGGAGGAGSTGTAFSTV